MNEWDRTGRDLALRITRAIKDRKLTNEEYGEIMALANTDHVVDWQERRLLDQLEEMIQNHVVARVSGKQSPPE